MKKQLYIIFFLYFATQIKSLGQINLVPNPSFEIFTNCPNNGSQIYLVPPWYTPTWGSPDYFNSCAPPYNMSVPSNFCGNQIAHTGVAYAGFYLYNVTNPVISESKEFLQIELTDTLIHERKYCVSFFVNLSVPNYQYNSYKVISISKIGLFISNDTISSTNQLALPYTPQIVSPTGVYMNDTLNWMEVSGDYIAHGGEKYITIGNFNLFSDTTTVVYHNNTRSAAYYYIDDVSVVDCTTVGVSEESKQDLICNIYPNPATSTLTIEAKNSTIKTIHIYNVLGCEMLNQVQHDGSVTIDVSGFAKGIYFIEAATEKGILRKKLVKE